MFPVPRSMPAPRRRTWACPPQYRLISSYRFSKMTRTCWSGFNALRRKAATRFFELAPASSPVHRCRLSGGGRSGLRPPILSSSPIAQWDTGIVLLQQLGDGGRRKRLFHRLQGLIEPAMKGAKPAAMGLDPQRAFPDALERSHGLHDVEHRDLGRRPRQSKAAVTAGSRNHQPAASQLLENLGQVTGRYLRSFRDGRSAKRRTILVSEPYDRSQCILGRLRNQQSPPLA